MLHCYGTFEIMEFNTNDLTGHFNYMLQPVLVTYWEIAAVSLLFLEVEIFQQFIPNHFLNISQNNTSIWSSYHSLSSTLPSPGCFYFPALSTHHLHTLSFISLRFSSQTFLLCAVYLTKNALSIPRLSEIVLSFLSPRCPFEPFIYKQRKINVKFGIGRDCDCMGKEKRMRGYTRAS